MLGWAGRVSAVVALALLTGCGGGTTAKRLPVVGVGPVPEVSPELIAFLETLPREDEAGNPIHYPVNLFATHSLDSVKAMTPGAIQRRFARPRPLVLEGAGIGLAVGPAAFCTPETVRGIRCETASLTDPAAEDVNVYVFVTGAESLNGAHFGIEYSEGIEVTDWLACPLSGAFTIRSDDFPASGSNLALAFNCVTKRGDRPHVLGHFRVKAGSTGYMQITGLAKIENAVAAVTRCDEEWYVANPAGFGRVILGSGDGSKPYSPCSPPE